MSRTLARIPLVLLSVLGLPATASADVCARDQPTRVRVFEQDGAYRACLRGYPSHRLGAGRPRLRRVKGTMLAYTARAKGRDVIASLDLADGDRWLRRRPAGGRVEHMALRGIGALIWTTDTGSVSIADLDGSRKVDQLAAPATGLRITRRLAIGDNCGAAYDYTFHWQAGGIARTTVWRALESYDCG